MLEHLPDTPLVIDRFALRSLGLSADTAISLEALNLQAARPFWEKLGLVQVSCPSGVILTSARRLHRMGVDPNDSAAVAELDDAVKEAVLNGRDASAGFYLVPAWLRLGPDECFAFPLESTSMDSKPMRDAPGMVEWEHIPQNGALIGS